MQVVIAKSSSQWEAFLQKQNWSPFLQSWSMGKAYEHLHQEVVRLEVRDDDECTGICQAIVVPARRGKHLMVQYGPVGEFQAQELAELVYKLSEVARIHECAFVRMSPFWDFDDGRVKELKQLGFRPTPLHTLAEHVWYLDLRRKSEEDLLAGMRKNTRNLIRRAEREGVVVERSEDPVRDLPIFLSLHEETRKRHGFTPYADAFFRAQVEAFAPHDQCVLYIARFRGEPVATSINMIYGNETSYHHGASSHKYPKCFASYLLQWRAIRDALKRGDAIYNFWGIAPEGAKRHPFAGVTLFKKGFGGELKELAHCMDLSLSPKHLLTVGVETMRKWRRGF